MGFIFFGCSSELNSETGGIRYNSTSQYIQCKDSQGWFNWRKASRELWNALEDLSVVMISKKSTASSTPTANIVNNVLKIVGGNGKGGCAYIEPQSREYTLHYTGTANYTYPNSDYLGMGYSTGISDGSPTGATTIETIWNNNSYSYYDKSFVVPAGCYVWFSVNNASATVLEWNFTELYGV